MLVQNNIEHEYDILYCYPIYDCQEETYFFADVTVNTTDKWIDRKAVCDFIGMNEEFNEIQFAIGCLEYYGAENFGTDLQNWQYSRDAICEILKHKLIGVDGGFIKQW